MQLLEGLKKTWASMRFKLMTYAYIFMSWSYAEFIELKANLGKF